MTDVRRVDAYEKVTGKAAYGTDRVPEGVAYAMLTPAWIGRGRVSRVDTAAAAAVPGVLPVVTRFDGLVLVLVALLTVALSAGMPQVARGAGVPERLIATWAAHTTLNALSLAVILHVAVWRRCPGGSAA
ncbi:hypothetical protein QRX60_33985 [Amycolatopsis mongoliensis]|uniref:Uncharacterized protein n=1 Tax=Amycolatopsis mongoliensis TaxID=715475 RepID=A0A9Y2NIC8_9PSEU|nr:hypothetical protein [Amycolatopsis sp. 4-36]WIX99039.1 hypothetical protein QRX60_33985 [Amycolatopsis sp. 4-36]